MTINERLKKYAGENPVRLHMPGNKGRYPLCGSLDVTELPQTLDIMDKSAETEFVFRRTGKQFGADITLYSCAGATLAIQTAIFAIARSKKLLVGGVHKSVSFAMALCDVKPVYFTPGDDITEMIDGACAVFITSEDYYGRIAPELIKEYSEICHKNGIPLICDNSHGSHLAFWSCGCLHPIKNGADIIIDSAHKTLPALTGGAFLHLMGKYALIWKDFIDAMEVFASTSPSYLIAASLEYAADYMSDNGEQLNSLKAELDNARNSLHNMFSFLPEKISDPFRLTLFCSKPEHVYKHLVKYGFIPEFYDEYAVVLIPSVMNTAKEIRELTECLEGSGAHAGTIPEIKKEERILLVSPREALFSEADSPEFAVKPIYKYPPGVAVVQPGEKYNQKKNIDL